MLQRNRGRERNRSLQTAEISVYSGGRSGEKRLLRIKELESVPKASTSCQLIIRLTGCLNSS